MRRRGTRNKHHMPKEQPGIRLENSHKCCGCPMYHKDNIRLYCPVPVCIREDVQKVYGR